MLSTKLMKQQIIPLFFSTKGRISRGLFWKAFIVLTIFFLPLIRFANSNDDIFFIIFLAGLTIYSILTMILLAKRLQDVSIAGWFAVIFFVLFPSSWEDLDLYNFTSPFVITSVLFLLIVGLLNGTKGSNRYGGNLIEYENNRLYINKNKGLPPPPPPLDNPISKFFLYVMMISFLPSLIVAGMVLPENVEKSTSGQSEPVTSSEKENLFVDKTLHFDESQYLAELMNIYNNPNLAPKIIGCKGDIYCNTFIALSTKWKNIPDSYRYKGSFDIKADAKKGITFDDRGRNIGLQRGFYFYNEQTNRIISGVENLENIPQDYEGGLAVLLYIEDKSGWTNDKTNGIFAETQQAEISNDLFLSDNKNDFGIKTTASGLKYKITKEGTGKQPDENSIVTVHYKGQLVNGKVFDSSIERGEPIEFQLNQVIPGWIEGIQLIKEGGKATLYIPSNLGYGEHGVPEMIPPNSPLIFDVELIQVK